MHSTAFGAHQRHVPETVEALVGLTGSSPHQKFIPLLPRPRCTGSTHTNTALVVIGHGLFRRCLPSFQAATFFRSREYPLHVQSFLFPATVGLAFLSLLRARPEQGVETACIWQSRVLARVETEPSQNFGLAFFHILFFCRNWRTVGAVLSIASDRDRGSTRISRALATQCPCVR